MNIIRCPIGILEVFEEREFKKAGIRLYQGCRELLIEKNLQALVVPEGEGLARLANLLQWDLEAETEYLDGQGIHADQIVHTGIHHLMDSLFAEKTPASMLFSEAWASAADLYLIGKLSQAGIETPFLQTAMESIAVAYEDFGDQDQLETILAMVTENPYGALCEAARFIYEFAWIWLKPESGTQAIQASARHLESPWYPLVHHYNIANWVFFIREKFPNLSPGSSIDKDIWPRVTADESSFLALFPSPETNAR